MIHKEKSFTQLSEGWVKTTIGQICTLINGRAFKKNEWSSIGLPIIRIQNLNNPNKSFNYCNFKIDNKYLVNKGQLLFAWSGTPGTSFGAHIWNRDLAVLNQHIFKIEFDESIIDKQFFLHLINNNVSEYIIKSHGTAGLAHITKKRFENSSIFIPHLAQQKRIASKIEQFYSKLDAGIVSLRNVKAQLQRYRQAVLKHAFEGKLTEEWRKIHRNHIDTVEAYVRQKKGEKKAYNLKTINNNELSELPYGWAYGKLENWVYIAGRIGWRGLKASEYTEDGPLFLSVHNINRGVGVKIDLSKGQHITEERYQESPEIQLKNDDILLVKDGAGIGKIGIVNGLSGKATVNSSLLVIRGLDLFEPKFLLYLLMGPKMQIVVKTRITGSATPHLFQRDIKKFELWIPPLEEQRKIIDEVDYRFSIIDEAEKIVEFSLEQSERLRQSVLTTAFEGRLVPQNPSDEPSVRLLKRILNEKEKQSGNKGKLKRLIVRKPKQTRLIRYVE